MFGENAVSRNCGISPTSRFRTFLGCAHFPHFRCVQKNPERSGRQILSQNSGPRRDLCRAGRPGGGPGGPYRPLFNISDLHMPTQRLEGVMGASLCVLGFFGFPSCTFLHFFFRCFFQSFFVAKVCDIVQTCSTRVRHWSQFCALRISQFLPKSPNWPLSEFTSKCINY